MSDNISAKTKAGFVGGGLDINGNYPSDVPAAPTQMAQTGLGTSDRDKEIARNIGKTTFEQDLFYKRNRYELDLEIYRRKLEEYKALPAHSQLLRNAPAPPKVPLGIQPVSIDAPSIMPSAESWGKSGAAVKEGVSNFFGGLGSRDSN